MFMKKFLKQTNMLLYIGKEKTALKAFMGKTKQNTYNWVLYNLALEMIIYYIFCRAFPFTNCIYINCLTIIRKIFKSILSSLYRWGDYGSEIAQPTEWEVRSGHSDYISHAHCLNLCCA